MSEQLHRSPIDVTAADNMRRLRIERGWSALQLAKRCTTFGEQQEPPVTSMLSRSKIAKVESAVAKLGLTDVWLLAGVFNVAIAELVADASGKPSLEERVASLEQSVQALQEAVPTDEPAAVPETSAPAPVPQRPYSRAPSTISRPEFGPEEPYEEVPPLG